MRAMGEESEHVVSTCRQMRRFAAWWGDPEFIEVERRFGVERRSRGTPSTASSPPPRQSSRPSRRRGMRWQRGRRPVGGDCVGSVEATRRQSRRRCPNRPPPRDAVAPIGPRGALGHVRHRTPPGTQRRLSVVDVRRGGRPPSRDDRLRFGRGGRARPRTRVVGPAGSSCSCSRTSTPITSAVRSRCSPTTRCAIGSTTCGSTDGTSCAGSSASRRAKRSPNSSAGPTAGSGGTAPNRATVAIPPIVTDGVAHPEVVLDGGLRLTVLSPTPSGLQRLAANWRAALAELNPQKAMLGRRARPLPPADPAQLDLAKHRRRAVRRRTRASRT